MFWLLLYTLISKAFSVELIAWPVFSRPAACLLLVVWSVIFAYFIFTQHVCSSLKRSGMTRVNGGSQFYLPPTSRLSRSGMNHTCLYSPPAQHHRTLAGIFISHPAEGRKLSWPGGLVKYCGGLPARRRSPIPVLVAASGNRTRDQRVASPTP